MNRFTSERFNSGESLVNFSHLEKIQTFKKFCSGEYLSHLQKIQFFRRFDCGHLLNISHICKDSDIQKIPLPENTIFSLGQNLNIIFTLHSTSHHFTSPPLCLPHFKPLCATSLLPFCLPHFVTPSVIFASLHLTSRNFTSPILSASLHATTLCLLFFFHHFTSLCATSLRLPSFPCLTSRHFASPPIFSHSLHLISRHFTSPPLLSTFTSLHFMPLRVAYRFFLTRFTSFNATLLHLPFCLPHFTPLHATSLRLVLCGSLHATSSYLPLFSSHFTPLHFTSHFNRLTSLHFMPLCFN